MCFHYFHPINNYIFYVLTLLSQKVTQCFFSYTVCSSGTERQATKRDWPNNTRPSGWCCRDFLPLTAVCWVCSQLFLMSILCYQITSGQLWVLSVHTWHEHASPDASWVIRSYIPSQPLSSCCFRGFKFCRCLSMWLRPHSCSSCF